MNIVHVLYEFPFPPTSGIRCDMGRRIAAFRALGHRIFVVTWAKDNDRPSAEQVAQLEAMVDGFEVLPIGRDFASITRRLWNMRNFPSPVAARIPSEFVYNALLSTLDKFGPDLIWLESIHPGWLACDLSKRFVAPLAYRSDNVEFKYMAEQARLASPSWFKLAVASATWGMENFERGVHKQASRVFDISADDLRYWRSQGFFNNEWLATQPDPAILATADGPDTARDIDLLFLGGLSSPNNAVGLRWFFQNVYPRILAAVPDVKLVIAGRKPPSDLANLVNRSNAQLIADPCDVVPLFSRARVLFNPILHGSGVNIKTIDMLATGRPVVTTMKGARGLPADVIVELATADRPEEFADCCISAVRTARAGHGKHDRRALIERVFGIQAVAAALASFQEEAVA